MTTSSTIMKQPDSIQIQFPFSHHNTSSKEEISKQTMQLFSTNSLLRSRKRQRQTTSSSPTPTPTPAPTPTITTSSTVKVNFGLPFFRLKGFHMPTIVNYSTFLSIMLTMWVTYLILPKGLRRHMCNGHRKRYKKSRPNRIIRTLGGTPIKHHSPKIRNPNGQRRDGLKFSRSISSEYSDESSVTSTMHRGKQKFMSVQRGSPQKRNDNDILIDHHHSYGHLNDPVSFGRSSSGNNMSERKHLSHMYSNTGDMNSSSRGSSTITSLSSSQYLRQHQHQHQQHHHQQQNHHHHQQQQQHGIENQNDLLYEERNKLISNDSVDLNSDNSTEVLSSTGNAIWGTPKRFVRTRIMDESNRFKRINNDNTATTTYDDPIDLLSVNHDDQSNKNSIIQEQEQEQEQPITPALSEVESFASAFYSTKISLSSSSSTSTLQQQNDTSSQSQQDVEPSPVHPDLTCGHNVPSQMVLSSTLLSFRDPGIRLLAHGTQCEPRRIWIRLDVANEQLSWRTENGTASSNNKMNSNDPDLVTLGQVHFIPLIQILFIDVGKTTAALQLLEKHDDLCFSILTDGGSLDLQASNKVERDAFVSCMCLILDTVYNHLPPERSWRRLNDGAGSSVGSSSYSSSTLSGSMKANSESTASSATRHRQGNSNNYRHDLAYASSSSTGTGSITGSDVFHGVDLGSQVSATFGEI